MDNLNDALGESAAEPQVTTVDSTPETEVAADAATTADADVETGNEIAGDGTGEAEAAADADATEDSATSPDPNDPFADLDESTRWVTDDEIKNFRLPKKDRQRVTEQITKGREAVEKVEQIGGDVAVQTLAPLGKLLTKPVATPEELDEVIEALAETNPVISAQFLQGAVASLFSEPEFADDFLKVRFGKRANVRAFESLAKAMDEYDADAGRIEELLKLDKAGVLDTEYARSQFTESFGQSDLYAEMVAKQKELESRIAKQDELLRDPSKLEQRTASADVTRAVSDFNTDFAKMVREGVQKVVDRVHWGEGPLTELLRAVVGQQLTESKTYADTVEFIRTNGRYREGDKLSLVAQTQLQLLNNAAQARAVEQVRRIQTNLAEIAKTSAQSAKQVKEAQVKANAEADAAPAKTAQMTAPPKSLEQQLAEKREAFKRQLKAEQAAGAGGRV